MLTTLIPRIPEYTSADAEAAGVHTRLTALETTTNARFKAIGEVDISEPVTEEGVGVSFKDVHTTVLKAEEDSQLFGLDEKLSLKVNCTQAGEISTKQGYIQHIRDCAGLVQKAKGEFEFFMTDFQVTVSAEAATAREHVIAMQNREESIRNELTTAILETQLLEKPSKKTKNKLVEELSKAVDKSMKDLKSEVEAKFRLLDLDFKQEALLLTLGFEANKLLNLGQFPDGDLSEEDAERLSTSVGSALATIEGQIEATNNGVKEALTGVNDLINETETKLTAFVKVLGDAMPVEQPLMQATSKGDFDSRLQGVLCAVARLRNTIEVRDVTLSSELAGVDLWTPRLTTPDETIAKATKLTARLHATTQALTSELEAPVARVSAVRAKAVKEAGLQLTPVGEEQEEQVASKPLK